MSQPNALISVYKKDGVVELARGLIKLGYRLLSSGGTAKAISDEGLAVTEVAEITNFPEMPGGLVKTLHPAIHGGILADRGNAEQMTYLKKHGIETIDLVICNLYPFQDEPSVKNTDIGGPTMLRAAAKNKAYVGVVVDPNDYAPVLEELSGNGQLSDSTRRELARKAFAHTAAYDTAIVNWFDHEDGVLLPPTLHQSYTKAPLVLRYGENPHQEAAVYRTDGADPWWDHITQHSGIPLSYLNMYDADAAWLLANEQGFADGDAVCAIIKHANPCGFAKAHDLASAYQLAFECDERSAFGGIVAVNQPINDATVEAMVAAAQADVVIAPGYAPGVVDRLIAKRKNTRLLEAPAPKPEAHHLRQITGGLLVQQPHHFAAEPKTWRVVTKRQPTKSEIRDAEIAFRLGGYVKSNSIVLVKDGVAWGIGAGQQNRVESGKIAAEKAAGRAKGGACGSDAFYPFPDGIEAAAESGVAVIVQPGGSVQDEACIAKADELGMAMIFTGERHFFH